MNTAFIALGSNLGDRLGALRAIATELAADVLELTSLQAVSPVYETKPMGPATESFANAVVKVDTGLAPDQLLDALLELEAAHGRVRTQRWAARTIDLDLLIYIDDAGTEVGADTERLQLPHPGIARRDFVLAPLVDLGFDRPLAQGRTAAETLERLPPSARTIIGRMGVLTSSPPSGG